MSAQEAVGGARSHTRSPWREAFEMIANRATRTAAEGYVLGESAQGRCYVKDLNVYREDGESEADYLARGLRMFETLRQGLPEAPVSPSKPEDGEKKGVTQRDVIAASKAMRKARAGV